MKGNMHDNSRGSDTLIAGNNQGFTTAAGAANAKADELVTFVGDMRDFYDAAVSDVAGLL